MTIAKLTSRFCRVIGMRTKRLCLVILWLGTGCEQADMGRDKPALRVDGAVAEAELGKQLKINRDALLKGSS